SGTCNKAAFIDGFKDAYVAGWNGTMNQKIAALKSQMKKKPKDKGLQQDYQVYRDHLIGTKGYAGNAAKYPAPGSNAGLAETCAPKSYGQGKAASGEALNRDLKALQSKL